MFGAGEKSKQVTVEVKGDTEVEGDEAFRLALSNLTASDGRVVLRGESSLAAIADDDDATPPPPPSDTTASAEGATTVVYAAKDNAGNREVQKARLEQGARLGAL